MSDVQWFFGLLFTLFASIYGLIWRGSKKAASLNTRVAILEDKDLEAQIKELTREVSGFRIEILDTNNKNMEKLFEKIDALRLEIKSDMSK